MALEPELQAEIDDLAAQAMQYDEWVLLSGLTVLTEDAEAYLTRSERDGTGGREGTGDGMDAYFEGDGMDAYFEGDRTAAGNRFDDVYRPTLERDDWERLTDETGLRPGELTSRAAAGDPDVSPLAGVEHEWLGYPGRELLARFGEAFHDVVCGPGGPYEQFQKGLLGLETLPGAIAAQILTVGFSASTLWVPLAVYVGVLVVKAGVNTYCEAPAAEAGDALQAEL